ncbi:conjugal transfer protein TraF [Campylobacter sp. RM12651]|uniref:conjugal transfer protein TraF n=1 Tax=Campylobacter sp. RM12651 TaxID=1660079 RepID=UPI001EFB1A65|nr:conjugal transfer protein TraF [Campylobacter sp. RM12651]ULO03747.1 F-type type IV conjugative transfer system protein TrbB [Campylobacter sp. RM12651]
MKNILFHTIILSTIISNSLFSLDNFYDDKKRGWFYYEKMPIQKEKKKKEEKKPKEPIVFTQISQIPLNSLNSLTAQEFRQAFELAKDTAVMNPTQENVLAVQIMNNFMSNNASEFTSSWQKNLLDKNNLIIADTPTTTFESNQIKKEKKAKEKAFFENSELNYFVFYDKVDDKLLNIKRLISTMPYQVPTKYINILEYPNMKKEYNLEHFPSIYAITPTQKKRISNGNLLTQDLIIYFTMFQLDKDKKEINNE